MASSNSGPSTEGTPGVQPPDPENIEAAEQTTTVAQTHARMEDLPDEKRLHDEDSDARIAGKLKAQGGG